MSNPTTAFDRVRAARSNARPIASDYISAMFTDFFELHGDRRFADDPAIIAGVARLAGRPVTVIGIEKGRGAKERVRRNFGAPGPEGYRKALRLMRQSEKFGRPVVCLVDTSGAYCGIEAEERGQGQAIAENLWTMSALRVPIVSILIGEGGSGGALALAVSDEVWMLENAIYSVISPEGCASILWKDAARSPDAAEGLRLTADNALALGVVERVISENGLGREPFYTGLGTELAQTIERLCACDVKTRTDARYDRFRRMGVDHLTGGDA